jgi:hypothetical protein
MLMYRLYRYLKAKDIRCEVLNTIQPRKLFDSFVFINIEPNETFSTMLFGMYRDTIPNISVNQQQK